MKPLETDRLVLRQWRDNDRAGFAALNADPVVMKYFPNTYDRAQSDASIDRFIKSIENKRFGFFAAELQTSREFIGFVGLKEVPDNLPFAPAIQIGWRLAQRFWGARISQRRRHGLPLIWIQNIRDWGSCFDDAPD